MRWILWSLPIFGLALGGWVWWQHDLNAQLAEEPRRIAELRDHVGVRRMLSSHVSFSVTDLVIGGTDGLDLRDFRGRIEREGRLKPMFGQARRLCVKGQHTPDCWEIAHLEIDGQPLDLAARATAATADAVADRAGPNHLQTAEIPLPDQDGAPQNEAAPVPRPTGGSASATPAHPSATHRVARPVINARRGPSTEDAIVTKLQAGVRLALVQAQDGWGRFVLLDGEHVGAEVWAALRILEAVP